MSDFAEIVAIETELVIERLKDRVVFTVKHQEHTGRSAKLSQTLSREGVEDLHRQLGDWLEATQ